MGMRVNVEGSENAVVEGKWKDRKHIHAYLIIQRTIRDAIAKELVQSTRGRYDFFGFDFSMLRELNFGKRQSSALLTDKE